MFQTIRKRLQEPRRFLQVLAGPRQVGKTTLAHYLELLHGAGLMLGLAKYSHGQVRQRGSSPTLQVLNTALMTAMSGREFAAIRQDADTWGRWVETSVGAHLVNSRVGTGLEVTYWQERNQEVDFVLQRGRECVAIEVKSGRRRESLVGMGAFARQFAPRRSLLVGSEGIPLEEFLSQPASAWLA